MKTTLFSRHKLRLLVLALLLTAQMCRTTRIRKASRSAPVRTLEAPASARRPSESCPPGPIETATRGSTEPLPDAVRPSLVAEMLIGDVSPRCD